MKEFILEYWLEGLFAGVCTAITYLYRKLLGRVQLEINEQKMLKEGMLAILHDRIYQACRHYLKQESIDIEGLTNIEYMYRNYHELGGNGTGTELYERVRKLPIKENDV